MRLRIPWLDRLRGRRTGTCPKCAHTTRLDQTYCQVCGYEIVQQAKARSTGIRPA